MDLRWYQKEAVESAFDSLISKSGNPVICLPTGSGKSLVIAELTRKAVEEFNGRVLILQHRKELIEQNREKVQRLLSIPIGSYSAGLNKREVENDVVLCGIQSSYDKATIFGRRHLVIIDESHLVPNNDLGMYRTFLSDLAAINPGLKIVGLTATPFRTGEGSICSRDGVFQSICYDAPIRKLIDQGYLCRVINNPSHSEVDTSKLKIRAGEFITKEVESLFDHYATIQACEEIVANSANRQSCLVFCSSVEHADKTAKIIAELTGERCESISGESLAIERATIIDDFRNQRLRWLTNVDVLTTGFDAPCIDLIAILRATASPGLFAQIVGRGLRVHESKLDCLILDFGQNIKRHGAIDAIDYGKSKKRGAGEKQEGPTKDCPACENSMPASKRECECGFRFPAKEPTNESHADDESKLLTEPETFDVESVYYSSHRKKGKEDAKPTLRVDYQCTREGGNISEVIREWVCIEHVGFAKTKATAWWSEHSNFEFPPDVATAVEWCKMGAVACPKTITAQKQGGFWRILSKEIEELPTELIEQVEEVPF
jgi:DNA repair protein RadD